MRVIEDLTEEEAYLVAILQDESGIDLAEFLWEDATAPDGVYRCWDFQYSWYRCSEKFQVDQCGRSLGKTMGIVMRAFAFIFSHPGLEMLITAPEMIHLEPVTRLVEDRILETRLSREMLKGTGTSNGITHRPFLARFVNGAQIVGRIPQQTGKGVKGMHPLKIELDESQDYPEAGYAELAETLKYGTEGATWRAHGVSRGVRDRYYKMTQPGSGWFTHRWTAMHRPDWSDEERNAKIEYYGSRDEPDYRRNILGLHGDASSSLFVLARLMACHPGNTLIGAVGADGEDERVTLDCVRVGDSVRTATGTGVVRDIRTSEHGRLVRVHIGSFCVDASEGHPFFTDRGWVAASDLVEGDRLVRAEDVPHLWGRAARECEEVLLPSLLARRRDPAPQDLSDLWRVLPRIEPEDLLLPDVCGDVEASEQPRARTVLRTLRDAHLDSDSFQEVLLTGVLERLSPAGVADHHVRGVRPELRHRSSATFLLAELCWEARRAHDVRFDHDEANHQVVRALRNRVLSSRQDGEVLLPKVREQGQRSEASHPAGSSVRALRRAVPATTQDKQVLLEAVLVRSETGRAGGREARIAREACGPWRTAPTAVRPVDGVGGPRVGVGAAEVVLAPGGARRPAGVVHGGPLPPPFQDDRGGGRVEPPHQGGAGEGSHPRRVVAFPRVDRVEVLEPGHPDWDRLSGGATHVVCYDLTVSGHPSFAVGVDGLLVHNCVDDSPNSPYNTTEYAYIRLNAEVVESSGLPITEHLRIPESHRRYGQVWIGMDVGVTNHPSEILAFGETSPARSGKEEDLRTARLKLLTRVHLERIAMPDQRAIIEWLCNYYRPNAFALDRTGVGLPLYQELVADSKLAPRIKGYAFNEKIIVGYEPAEGDDEPEPIMAPVIEWASDQMRLLVDTKRLTLPWDTELLRDWQGVTYTIRKSPTDAYGRKSFSKGSHTLDAGRMAILAYAQRLIEDIRPVKRRMEPVLDSWVA